jgi:hypothetical protein
MKIDRPFVQLRELFRITNLENRELLKYTFEKSDSISLWVIGLAVGGITIVASKIGDVNSAISTDDLRVILLLLAISVTCGIFYRSLFLYFFSLHNHALRGIDISLSGQRMMSIDSNLTGNESFIDLIEELKNGFGEDLSFLIPIYEDSTYNRKEELYTSVANHYKAKIEFARKDTQNFFEFIADTYSKFYGLDKTHLIRTIHNPQNSGEQYRTAYQMLKALYLFYIVSFLAALFSFVFAL